MATYGPRFPEIDSVSRRLVSADVLAAFKAQLEEAGVGVAFPAVNVQTGTTYDVVVGDAGDLVTLNNAASITVTLPADAAAPIPVGGRVTFAVLGAGSALIKAAAGATVNGSTTASVTKARWTIPVAVKVSANTWVVA